MSNEFSTAIKKSLMIREVNLVAVKGKERIFATGSLQDISVLHRKLEKEENRGNRGC